MNLMWPDLDISLTSAPGQQGRALKQGVEEPATTAPSPRWRWARLLPRVFALILAFPLSQGGKEYAAYQ